jgi:hypothetical protein
MRLHYLPENGATSDGCSFTDETNDPPIRTLPNIYLSNSPYRGVVAVSIAIGFLEYSAVDQLRVGHVDTALVVS